MLSKDQLDIFLKLQQVVLNSEDHTSLVKKLTDEVAELYRPIEVVFSKKGEAIIKSEIKSGEQEFIAMLASLFGIAYKIQDTQTSLSNTTQEVYKMNAELHQLDKLKDDFVSIASHELRTPMTAIRSYVWMALHRSDVPLSQKLERYLYRTLVSTERLINLVNDMLNISRIEAGRIEIIPKSVDILELVKDVMEEVNPKAIERGIKLAVYQQKLPPVFADPDKLRQVLMNLIGNSLKFTPPDGVITASFFTDGEVVEISIKDTGKGISRDDLSKLFKKFGRLDNSYVAIGTSGGTGLGLYICKNLIDLMHGKIWATSEGFDKGSSFYFSLPIATDKVLKEAAQYTIKPVGEAKPLEPVAI